MPSPFPGMNPFLEQDSVWQDFHDTFLPQFRAALTPQVTPHFIVKIEEYLFIHEPSAEERLLIGHGDVSIARAETGAQVRTATIEAPARIRIPSVDFEKHIFLEIRDRDNRELVTVVELLSPTNKKPGPDREQYLAKRGKLLGSAAHFIEIDLLRGGPRMPMEPQPTCDYCVMICRVEDRPYGQFWPLLLREALPLIPIPLRGPAPDAKVDLQEILNRVYDEAGYKYHIYHHPPQPPLSPDDEAWAASILGK